MPGITRTLIESVTLGSAVQSVSFATLPTTFRDLIIVAKFESASGGISFGLDFNGVSTNTNRIVGLGQGIGVTAPTFTSTAPGSQSVFSGNPVQNTSNGGRALVEVHIFNYNSTTAHKHWIGRGNADDNQVSIAIGRWAQTTALTTLSVNCLTGSPNLFNTGSVFSLYGVIA